jgi:hypothetical protein
MPSNHTEATRPRWAGRANNPPANTMKYIVENTRTEKISEHRTWGAAMRAAAKAGESHEVVITERDRDGERTYNTEGQVMSRDGHWVN